MTKQGNHQDIWVYVELDGSAPKNVGLELFSSARSIAQARGEKVAAVLIGVDTAVAAQTAASLGAEQVFCVEGPEYAQYSTDAYAHALCTLVQKHKPYALLMGATDNGRDLAPRVSCRLRTGLTADCIDLGYNRETGNIDFICPAFSGNLVTTITCPHTFPQMGTVRAGVFKIPEATSVQGNIITEQISFPLEAIRTKILESNRVTGTSASDIENADIVVAGGRGVGGKEQFTLLRQLADELGGSVATSRPPVDFDWMPHECMVGQTGKNVSPKLYIACGISGAIQHCAGMSGAEMVIAINKDPHAPIFNYADYGVVGTVQEVVPALIQEIKRIKSES